jgi:hypothetical protein
LDQRCISIENIESGEIVELERYYLKNCKRINNLKEMYLPNTFTNTGRNKPEVIY